MPRPRTSSSRRPRGPSLGSALGPMLGALRKLSASPLVDRYGLRQVAETLLYRSVRDATRAGSAATQRWKSVRTLLPQQRLQPAKTEPAAVFDLTLTESQQLMRETLHRFADETLRPHATQADREGAADGTVYEAIAELGLNLDAIPEALGGVGESRSAIDGVLMAEDLARGDMGLALAALAPRSVVVALTEFGTDAQQGRYLPAFAEERFVPAAMAMAERRVHDDPWRPRVRATTTDAGYVLSGAKCFVPLVERAELLLVTATLDGQAPRTFIVHGDEPGVRRVRERHMGLDAAEVGTLHLDEVVVPREALLGGSLEGGSRKAARDTSNATPYDHAKLVALAQLGACALAVGTGQAVLDYVMEYCNTRVAFGEPISHRQAVAFMIADLAIELEGMRLCTYRAASRAAQGLPFTGQARLAFAACCRHAMKLGSDGVQLLGGHGYVAEHPVEQWYRQLRSIGVVDGGLLP